MNFIKNLFLTNRFFFIVAILTGGMMLSYAFPFLFAFVKTGCILFAVLILIDILLLYNRSVVVTTERDVPSVLSLGDDNIITLSVRSKARIKLFVTLIDELPEQFQMRHFTIKLELSPDKPHQQTYTLRPVARGEYIFGKIHLYLTTGLGFIKRRITGASEVNVPVYPSIIQMKRYELKTFARTATEYGVKKVRRIGHSYEFEHIRQYIRGDDYRSINWKATSRRAHLMINQYEDEKSQQVYCIIDKSRVMHMPFNGLSLFDYAVNAALVISNIVLGKQDKAGLITFAETPKALIKADRSKTQLKKILDTLYKEKEGAVEANYESMYMTVRNFVNGRSLLFLYTNFESTYALQRVLPQLRRLNDQHLLVVIFFENTEITTSTSQHVETLEDIYTQVTAENYVLTKAHMVQQLKQFGIISILTKPEHLTVASINKYLELKSRGMI
ncbi:DUF58 domain-containing protein [Ohtaekwangia kribbensis]|jgi:uncharacterized protein (DUF58 family)|uniref:DUF58 domain-containing protein n=1 Tax=Ohtaekwangia kribbensis TaxID=688913 RepID=A0ABW3K060_9BACT